MAEKQMVLAGDIGGTKVVLALYEYSGGQLREAEKHLFKSADYQGLDDLIADFLSRIGGEIAGNMRVCLGVAGPVVDGRCRVTNLPWIVDAREIDLEFDFQAVSLINDLEAIAGAVPHLTKDDVEVLNAGGAVKGGMKAVLAPGTGLGEAFLVKCGKSYTALPSEGGHSDLAPNTRLEGDLIDYLGKQFEHVSCERAISGEGIRNIYSFLKEKKGYSEPDWLAQKIETAEDPNPVICSYSSGNDAVDICRQTMNLFVSILGAEAGNLALKMLANGGVYLGGGIPPKILALLRGDGFLHAFYNKGRMSDLVRSMPVYCITHPEPALLGAAWNEVDGLL